MEPRPHAFHKMEALIREMQDPETGVPVRSQKIFLTSIPSAFIGYDLIEWLMEHLNIEEAGEAVHLANQLCQYGYIFPVTDCKNLTVKDDNSLYRFQAAYYWPWHHRNPDNMEYAIYLVKRTMRNKQRHALEEYEVEALNSLKRALQNKWELVTMQAEEQAEDGINVQKNSGPCVKIGKERKKTDKLVADSQERAYWRIHKPPPGCVPPLEPSPILSLRRVIPPTPGNTELDILKRQVSRSRIKCSQGVEGLVAHSKTYAEYDPFLTPPQPSNPWLSDDPSFWQFNAPLVEVPTEKRVKRWALSFEDLLSDPTGVEEFTNYLRKEYSHENIRFWLAVKELRRCSLKEVPARVNSIFEEFLAHGAPCEINIDSKTQEASVAEMKNPTRFTFEAAAHHVYTVLLAKDCYPRFIRSDQFKSLLANALHPPTKKRFFNFGGGGKKKSCVGGIPVAGGVGKRRGSDRSLTGAAHELPSTYTPHVPLSTSQSNLHELPPKDSGVSPERTVAKKESKPEVNVAGLQVPGPSVEGLSRKLSNCNLEATKGLTPSEEEAEPLSSSEDVPKVSVEVEEVPKEEEKQEEAVAEEEEMSSSKKEEVSLNKEDTSLSKKEDTAPSKKEEMSSSTSKKEEMLLPKKEEDEAACLSKKKGRWKVRHLSEGKTEEGSADDAAADPAPPQTDICPWEDEENCKTEEPFVKKYATLGYL